MDKVTTIPISEARRRIFEIAEDVQKPGRYYTLTEKGRPKMILMSTDEFESWMETMEVMRDFPDIAKDIEETDEAVKTGAYKKWTTLEDLDKAWGLTVADKSSKKYAISSRLSSKGKKKSR